MVNTTKDTGNKSAIVGSNFKPTDKKPVRELINQPKFVSYDFQGALVDNNKTRLDDLIQHVSGSRVRCFYFRQVLGHEDSPTQFSLSLSPVNQQYERIDELEILMQSSLSSNLDEKTTRTTVNGTAHIRPPLIPNVGDVLFMDYGRVNFGIFVVKGVNNLSHMLKSVFEIEFELTHEVEDQVNDEWIKNLIQKTVVIKKWVENFLENGQNPILEERQASNYVELADYYVKLKKRWFEKFYAKFYQTFPIPQQSKLSLDGFFMKAIGKWFSSRDHQHMITFTQYSDDEFPILATTSLWDALSAQDEWMLEDSFHRATVLSKSAFKSRDLFGQVADSSFQGIIAPESAVYTNQIYVRHEWEIGKTWLMEVNPTVQLIGYYEDIPFINTIDHSRGYVLSAAFWNNERDGMSHLEIMVKAYLAGNGIDNEALLLLIEDSRKWGVLEQFYYIPIITLLINYSIRRI